MALLRQANLSLCVIPAKAEIEAECLLSLAKGAVKK
jgi:hypothetical protein